METRARWWANEAFWAEAFALVNISFLAFDIYLAHSVNQFRRPEEYIPLWFSIAAPVLLAIGLGGWLRWGWREVWRDFGFFVGFASIVVGVAGVVFHLDSRFFYDRTIQSLTYAAPFAAPLAYTGLGLLLIMNRMVPQRTREWAMWILLLSLGGFFGNFVLSLTDHAENGFFRPIEWLPVVSSAFAVSTLLVPFLVPVTRRYLGLIGVVLGIEAVVGVLGFVLHAEANLHGPSVSAWSNFVYGAPPFAPLLFPNLVILAMIGLWNLRTHLPE
jgi:hypothetical protein